MIGTSEAAPTFAAGERVAPGLSNEHGLVIAASGKNRYHIWLIHSGRMAQYVAGEMKPILSPPQEPLAALKAIPQQRLTEAERELVNAAIVEVSARALPARRPPRAPASHRHGRAVQQRQERHDEAQPLLAERPDPPITVPIELPVHQAAGGDSLNAELCFLRDQADQLRGGLRTATERATQAEERATQAEERARQAEERATKAEERVTQEKLQAEQLGAQLEKLRTQFKIDPAQPEKPQVDRMVLQLAQWSHKAEQVDQLKKAQLSVTEERDTARSQLRRASEAHDAALKEIATWRNNANAAATTAEDFYLCLSVLAEALGLPPNSGLQLRLLVGEVMSLRRDRMLIERVLTDHQALLDETELLEQQLDLANRIPGALDSEAVRVAARLEDVIAQQDDRLAQLEQLVECLPAERAADKELIAEFVNFQWTCKCGRKCGRKSKWIP